MTIASTPSEISYAGDGVSTVFPIPFQFDTAADLKVVQADTDGNVSSVTGFSAAGGGGSTGTLTLLAALASGMTLTILDNPTLTQDADYVSNDAFPAETHEHALDKGVRISKRLYQLIKRTLRTADGDPIEDLTLGSVDNRKGKYLFFDAVTGAIEYAANVVTTTLSNSIIAQLLWPQSPAEQAVGISPGNYPPGDLRRYGIVPNSVLLAGVNTAALKALWNPLITAGPRGRFYFPNTTGADTYYFNGVIPIRDGVSIDAQDCTLNFTGAGTAADTNSGFFFALRDFTLENVNFVISWATGVSTSSGNAVQIGARASDSSYFTVYDSLLPAPMGNITLRNIRIDSTVTGANLAGTCGINILGGVQGLVAENIYINGNGVLTQGITYEFGWATAGTASARETSHARNLRFANIDVKNLDTTTGIGMVIAGAYSFKVDNLTVTSAASVMSLTPGESLFYRPWANVDQLGAKHNVKLTNIVGQKLYSNGLVFAGAQLASGGYLSAVVAALGHPADYIAQTDLYDVSMENFVLDGSGNPGNGWGISSSASKLTLKSGKITGGFQRGIVLTDECTLFDLDGLSITGCQQMAIQGDLGAAVWNPARLKKGRIVDCYFGGNSTSGAGTFQAITLNNCDSVLLENNRSGYESAYDGLTETTQGGVLKIGAGCFRVLSKANRVAALTGGAVAYQNVTTSGSNQGNTIQSARNLVTTSGMWLSDLQSATAAVTAGNGTIGTAAVAVARVAPAAAVTGIILEPGGFQGQQATVINESAAVNTLTFAASGTSNVAKGTGEVIAGLASRSFTWDTGTSLWY